MLPQESSGGAKVCEKPISSLFQKHLSLFITDQSIFFPVYRTVSSQPISSPAIPPSLPSSPAGPPPVIVVSAAIAGSASLSLPGLCGDP